MMLLSDLIHQQGIPLSWVKHVLLPRCMAFVYYYLTRHHLFFKTGLVFFHERGL